MVLHTSALDFKVRLLRILLSPENRRRRNMALSFLRVVSQVNYFSYFAFLNLIFFLKYQCTGPKNILLFGAVWVNVF